MAINARELLLIVRAQNQASGALRRVANDVRGLSRLQELGLRRNQLAIQQGNLMRQQRRALNELESVTTGRRYMQAQREKQSLLDKQLRTQNALKTNLAAQTIANAKLAEADKRGMKKRSIGYKQLQLNAQRLVDTEGRYRTTLRSIGPAMAAAEQRMVGLKQRASVLNSELSTTSQRIGQLAAQQRALNREISAARWDRFQFAGRTIAHLGRVAQLSGLVIGAGIGFAADAAAKFQTQVALVATQTGKAGSGVATVTKNAQALNQIILRQMPKSIATVQDLTSATYDLFSSVDSAHKGFLTLADGAKLLDLANKAAIAGQTDLQTAVESIIRPMNAFGFSAAQMPRILGRTFAAVRFGQLTFQQFASTLQTTAPAAKAAGQNFDTLAGTMAFLSRRLGDTRSAVGFARLTEILSRAKFIEGLKKFNVDITDTQGHLLQLPQVIDRLVTRFPKLRQGGVFLTQFFKAMSGTEGTIQARRAFVFLAQQLDQYSSMVNRVSGDNAEFNRSFQALNQTAGVRWAKFLNELRALMLQFGAAALPTLFEMLKPIQQLVDWFGNLDESTRRSIGKWAAYGAAILLVGGTIASVGGSILAMIAVLGRLGVAFPAITAAVLAFAVAAEVIKGNWSGLGGFLSSIFDQITSSWVAFIATAAALVVAILKVRAAIISLQVASAAGGGAGILSRLLGGVGIAGATGGLAALGAALPVVVGGLAAFSIAALIWKRHADEMSDRARRLAEEQKNLASSINDANSAAASVKNIATSVFDVRSATLDLKDLNSQIADYRKQLKQAPNDEKAAIRVNLERALIGRAQAYERLQIASEQANMRIRSFNRFMAAQAITFDKIGKKEAAIASLRKELDRINKQPDVSWDRQFMAPRLENQIQKLEGDLQKLRTGFSNATGGITRNFTSMVRQFQRADLLPKRISQGAIGDLVKLSTQLGRMPTLKEMRLFFKAEIDPNSLRQLPATVANFIRRQRAARAKVKVQADLSFDSARAEHLALMTGKIPKVPVSADTSKAKSEVNAFKQWFGGNSKIPPFKISSQPTGVALGTDIKAGVMAGVSGLTEALSAYITTAVNHAIEAGKAAAKAQSPSKRTRDEIGKPLMQGIIVGIISQFGNIKKTADMTQKEWTQAWMQSFKDAKKSAVDFLKNYYDDVYSQLKDTFFSNMLGDLNQIRMDFGLALDVPGLTQQLTDQTNALVKYQNQWNKLLKRGAPLELLQQLQQMGPEGQAIISALAGSSNKDLRAYIKAWKRAQKELDKIAKQQMKQQIKDWKQMGKSMALGIILGIRDQKPQLVHFFQSIFQEAVAAATGGKGKNRTNAARSPMLGAARLNGGGFGAARMAAPINMTVNAHYTETLDTTLRRATFRMKHKR